jgi:hypothetical protein
MSLEVELEQLFATKPEAWRFIQLFNEYCNLLDDQIDEVKDDERTRKISTLAARIFNCPFWQRWSQNLYFLERAINNCYFDSTRWEKAEEDWKRRTAQVLASCGIMMLFVVIMIEFGEDEANKWTLRMREFSYEKHKNDL